MDKNKNIIARSPSIPQDIRAEAISKDVIASPFDKLRARSDSLSELPKGWVWTKLAELVSNNVTKGSTPTSYGYSFKDEGISFIKTENIKEDGNIANITDFIDKEANKFLKR